MAVPAKLPVRPEVAKGLADIITMFLQEELAEPKEQIRQLGDRVDTIEQRMEREGLTRSQGRALQKAVAKRVHDIAKELNDTRQQHFANVYGSLKDRYNVPSYLEIPRDKFADAVNLANTYDGSGRNWWTD